MSERDTLVNLEEIPPTPQTSGPAERPSISVFRKRLRKFRTIKRGYYSFLILLAAYGISFLLPMLINNEALLVRYDGKFYFPLIHYYPASTFGQERIGEPDYRDVARELRQENKGNWAVLPPYPYSPTESLLDLPGSPPNAPSRQHIFGTDDRGRDIFARLAYGFNVSLSFALLVLVISLAIGVSGRALGIFCGQTGYSRTAPDRNMVFASVSLHHHHRELDRGADLSSGKKSRFAAVFLAADFDLDCF
jgi:ABC-type microcin C transport system permease subunit YejE